jgi:hypothetical protein
MKIIMAPCSVSVAASVAFLCPRRCVRGRHALVVASGRRASREMDYGVSYGPEGHASMSHIVGGKVPSNRIVGLKDIVAIIFVDYRTSVLTR